MCGMTRKDDLAYAVSLGVHAVGVIFYENSPRCLSIEQARTLLAEVPPFVEVVAVLVNPAPKLVQEILTALPVGLLQFHGDESPEFCQSFGAPFIKTIAAQNSKHIEKEAANFPSAKGLLLDSASALGRGGTGVTFDWSIIPATLPKPYILAGGLNPENVLEAVQTVHPYAIDVCSGIEAAPGIKDHKKMKKLISSLWGVE